MKILLTFLVFLFLPHLVIPADSSQYAVAVLPTPVFNIPNFEKIFGGRNGTLHLDSCRQIRELEFIAYPGTVFRVESVIPGEKSTIYRVTTAEYPYSSLQGYFIDARFVKTTESKPLARTPCLPSRAKIMQNLLAAHGSLYVWGGNFHDGIPKMLELYPAGFMHLTAETKNRWQLRGVDCSGLLYEATGGYTPRNTSALIRFGAPVPIAGLNPEQIMARLEPLDLVVWNGHVVIVLNREEVIESRLDCGGQNGGVRVHSLREALERIMRERVPVNSYDDSSASGKKRFVVRRWYDG